MCGIVAIIDLRHQNESTDRTTARERELLSMLGRIGHRGDTEHFGERWVAPGIAMGTNRLAIVDRAHADQPQADPSGRVRVVYNGEIYGFRSCRDELRRLGHTFTNESDTEVVLHAYLEWGEACVNRFDGMFAFVIYDGRRHGFFAARDHVGIKPLYYARRNGVYHFASEQKCLTGVGAPIETVLPGTFLTESDTRRWFDLDALHPVALPDQEAVRRYRELFDAAVRRQVDTDLPVAITFSGGIDSAAVLHTARKYHPNVTAITIGLDGAADVPVAERYCQEYGVPHTVGHIDRDDLIGVIGRIVRGAEFFEPIDVMDTCVGYFAFKLAQEKGFKLALCGEGSDEVMAGYDLFRDHPDPDELMRYRVRNLHRTDLQRVDRSSMMNSIETRVPFLDRQLLEFAYHVPMHQKLRGSTEKWLLREAFRGSLPAYVVDRPKVRMPDGSGMKNILLNYARSRADDRPVRPGGLDMRSPEGEFFLGEYLDAGFPMPTERHKLAGYDYSANNYFEFIS